MATVTSVTNHFITAKEGFSTTLASSISSGATTVPLNSTAGYTDGDAVALTIEPASATAKQVFTGIKSGTSIINVVWTEGTNQAHAAGVTVIDYTTATHQAALAKGLLVSINPTGTLKNNVVTTTAIADANVTTAKLADASITNTKLSTSAITLGYAQITSTVVGTTSGTTAIAGLTLTITIPAGGRRIRITAEGERVRGSVSGALYGLNIWDGAVNTGTVIKAAYATAPKADGSVPARVSAIATPAAGTKTYSIGIYEDSGTCAMDVAANSPAYILVEAI